MVKHIVLRDHLLSSRQAHLCGGERGIDKVKEWALQEPVSTRAPRYKKTNSKKIGIQKQLCLKKKGKKTFERK